MSTKIVTTDREDFLQAEYTDNFERIFKDQDGKDKKDIYFETMDDCVMRCEYCGVCYWLDTQKRCDCDYQRTLKKEH